MNEVTGGWDDTEQSEPRFKLRLFIAGASTNSIRAVANLKAICEKYLAGRYDLEVVDVHQEELLAENEQIVALPLLIKQHPSPVRRMIGDMSDTKKVLKGLGLAT